MVVQHKELIIVIVALIIVSLYMLPLDKIFITGQVKPHVTFVAFGGPSYGATEPPKISVGEIKSYLSYKAARSASLI